MRILAGDIGGTKSALALYDATEGTVTLVKERSYPSRQYASFEKVLAVFLKEEKADIQKICLGVAGPVLNGRCEMTNLPWIVDAGDLTRQFGISSVVLLNDLEATAYGTLDLAESDFCILNSGQSSLQGNRAVIAAGTGLGEAILFWDGSGYRSSASEGGHADFAPRSVLEIKLLKYLTRQYGRASYERVLSGQGLWDIYRFLKETGEEEPPWLAERLAAEDPGALISRVALAEKVPVCVKALDLFVSVYGAAAGNLALVTFALGGVYLGGGIAPRILDKLREGPFMKAFLDKGRFSSLLNRIPVKIILKEKTALIGAARFARSFS